MTTRNVNWDGTSLSGAHMGHVAHENLAAAIDTPATEVAKLSVTVGAEAANVIPVSVVAQDRAGNVLAQSIRLHCRLYTEAMIEVLAAAYTMAASVGTVVSTTAQAALVVDTTAAGLATINVTDVSTTSTDTLYLEITPEGREGASEIVALTFA